MSFLNPVNETVLRFKSTDAGAPQIDYNSRVAGDVKAVLKACLVTGYGAIGSAGWSAVNEVGNVIEFVSPAVAMSDYRLGIDDTSAASATWYYYYQDLRTNALKSEQSKSFSSAIDQSNATNGWQLLVTQKGIIFIEILYSKPVTNNVARITHIGMTKEAVNISGGVNISSWDVGLKATSRDPTYFFSDAAGNSKIKIGGYIFSDYSAANIERLKTREFLSAPVVSLMSPIYMYSAGTLIAQQPAVILKDIPDESMLYGVYDDTLDGRPILSVCVSYDFTAAKDIALTARNFLIYLDYWEY